MLKRIVVTLGLLVGSFLAAWGASSTLSGLSSGGPISGTDLFYDVQSPGVGGVKVTGSQFLTFVFGNVSGACTASGTGLFTCPATTTPTFSNVTITGNLTAASAQFSGALTVKVRSSSVTTVTISATSDYFMALDPTSNAITVNLPAAPATGLTYLIKDATGQASVHNITVVPASGNIDGTATFALNSNFQSIAVTYSGTQWSIN